MLKKVVTLIFTAFSLFVNSQVSIGGWQDHLSFNACLSVSKLNDEIFAANYSGLMIYNTSDKSVERLNKINGLSDVGIKFIRENTYNNRLLVFYENSNIDVVTSDHKVFNYADLYKKNFSGKKNINEVLYSGKYAYLSCGFGIALFDTEKLEIKDTYIFGPNGTNMEVYQIAMTDSLIYAATPNGLYKCNYKTKLPNIYQNWQKITSGIADGCYAGVVKYNSTVVAAFSLNKLNGFGNMDTLYQFTGTNWVKFPYKGFPYVVKKLKVFDNNILAVSDQFGALYYGNTGNVKAYITQYNNFNTKVNDMYYYGANGFDYYWIADLNHGLIMTNGSNPFYSPNFIGINGVHKNYLCDIDAHDGKIGVAPSYINNGGGATYDNEGINIYEDETWSYLRKLNTPEDTITDYCAVLFDRKDPRRVWASSWIYGLLEYKDHNLIKVYNSSNTNNSIQPVIPGWHRASGLDMDDDGNLWMAVSDVPYYLTVKKTNGVYTLDSQQYNHSFTNNGNFFGFRLAYFFKPINKSVVKTVKPS